MPLDALVELGSAVPAPADDSDTRPVATRAQILIVDDMPANLVALESALEPMGRKILRATSGKDALAQVLDHELALVLLDVQMPDMDGLETASLIRARERTRHLPIIFVTAHDYDRDLVLRAYRLGAVDFLFKPIEPQILLAKAMVFVELQQRTDELATERLQRELEVARRDFEADTLRAQMQHEQAAKEELATLNAALADMDRRKDSFLAILGHELRNPLAAMRTAIDLIGAKPGELVITRALQVLDRQTSVLSRLVEDLLDVSRIHANKIELRPEKCDLRTVVDAAVATCRPAIDQRSHALTVEQPAEPVAVVVDQVRMAQVLTNLIANAARYTPPGGTVRVECTCDGEQAVLRVTDTGIGIPADLLPRIFEMFVQERARSDGSGGLGLGLALAKELVEMHHGTLAAHSAGRGRGSCFELRVPLDETHDVMTPRTRSDAMQPLERPPQEPLRVIVIDDNADARELVAELLRTRGHDVLTAGDGLDGFAMITEHRPDAAIIDLGLPDLDGVTLARELRAKCPGMTTRLIALTGYGHEADRTRTAEAGFHAHLIKPATMTSILDAISAPRKS